ncbi:MAG: hypothetical protein Kow00124_23830 [Anaerolineae bacterium]
MKQHHPASLSGRLTILIALLLGLALLLPTPAAAQGEITLASLTVRVWPEFDRPSSLVFLMGELSPGVTLPADLTFSLPPTAAVNAVAYEDPATGDLLTAQSSQVGNLLTMTSPNGTFHIEYYDLALSIEGDQRSYALSFPLPYTVTGEIVIEVQQPVNASGLSVTPAGGTTVTDALGLPAYVLTLPGAQAGETVALSFTYTKPDTALTADQFQQPPVIPPVDTTTSTAGAAGGSGLPLGWTIAIVLVGVAAVSAGVFLAIRNRRPAPRTVRPTAGAKRFCTQCGKPVPPDARFCPHCGAALRR